MGIEKPVRLSWIAGALALLVSACAPEQGDRGPRRSAEASGAPQDAKAPAERTTRVLVGYHSRTGNTEEMARAVAQGAERVPGVSVTMKRIADITREDLDAADGLVLGSPTYFANIPGVMKAILDEWSWKEKVDFTDKVGGAFATGGDETGGKEHVVVSLLLYMLHNRMIVVGPLQGEGKGGWGQMGATAVTGPADPGIDEDEIDAARRLGKRVAEVAKRR